MLTSSYFPVPVCWPCNTFYPCLLYPWHMHASHSAYGAAKPRELLKQTGTITFFSTRKRWVVLFWKEMAAQCLKITQKVAFNITSEASYFYTFSGQKFIKNAKKRFILAIFWKLENCGQIVLPDRSLLVGQKLVENAKNWKIKMRHFLVILNNVWC